MKNNKWLNRVAALLLIIFAAGGLAACANETPAVESESVATAAKSQVAKTGVLYIRVNPEVAVHYDEKGKVTELSGKNDDGTTIIEKVAEFKGKEVREVVKQLVSTIGDAGYFVEEVEGESRKVTIELERGSILPDPAFLSDIVADVREVVTSQGWKAPVTSPNEEAIVTDDDSHDNRDDDVNEFDDSGYDSNNYSGTYFDDDITEGDDFDDDSDDDDDWDDDFDDDDSDDDED